MSSESPEPLHIDKEAVETLTQIEMIKEDIVKLGDDLLKREKMDPKTDPIHDKHIHNMVESIITDELTDNETISSIFKSLATHLEQITVISQFFVEEGTSIFDPNIKYDDVEKMKEFHLRTERYYRELSSYEDMYRAFLLDFRDAEDISEHIERRLQRLNKKIETVEQVFCHWLAQLYKIDPTVEERPIYELWGSRLCEELSEEIEENHRNQPWYSRAVQAAKNFVNRVKEIGNSAVQVWKKYQNYRIVRILSWSLKHYQAIYIVSTILYNSGAIITPIITIFTGGPIVGLGNLLIQLGYGFCISLSDPIVLGVVSAKLTELMLKTHTLSTISDKLAKLLGSIVGNTIAYLGPVYVFQMVKSTLYFLLSIVCNTLYFLEKLGFSTVIKLGNEANKLFALIEQEGLAQGLNIWFSSLSAELKDSLIKGLEAAWGISKGPFSQIIEFIKSPISASIAKAQELGQNAARAVSKAAEGGIQIVTDSFGRIKTWLIGEWRADPGQIVSLDNPLSMTFYPQSQLDMSTWSDLYVQEKEKIYTGGIIFGENVRLLGSKIRELAEQGAEYIAAFLQRMYQIGSSVWQYLMDLFGRAHDRLTAMYEVAYLNLQWTWWATAIISDVNELYFAPDKQLQKIEELKVSVAEAKRNAQNIDINWKGRFIVKKVQRKYGRRRRRKKKQNIRKLERTLSKES